MRSLFRLVIRRWATLVVLTCSLIIPSAIVAEIGTPPENLSAVVRVSADNAHRWKEGNVEIWLLRGNCEVHQGNTTVTSKEAVIWLDLAAETDVSQNDAAIVYAEGAVNVSLQTEGVAFSGSDAKPQVIQDEQWLGRFYTSNGIQMDVDSLSGKPATDLPILDRAVDYRRKDLPGRVQPVDWVVDEGIGRDIGATDDEATGRVAQIPGSFPLSAPATQVAPVSETRVRFLPRGSRAPSLKSFPSNGGSEQVWIATGGVKVVVESDEVSRMSPDGQADRRIIIEADEVVAWTNSLAPLQTDGQPVGQTDKRWELYLEGNIVFATGKRVIYADRMYYDTILQRGTVLNAEMLSPIADYDGLVRLKADVLQQVDENNFQAYGAAVTTSRLGVPRYWLQSNDIQISQFPINKLDPVTGQTLIDPQTGFPQTENDYQLNSRNNYVYVGQIPFMYWPSMTTNLKNSSYYLNNIAIKNDSVFGTQILTEWDLHQVLGIKNPMPGTQWTLDADYLSARGPALGTNYNYRRNSRAGIGGPYSGEIDVWGIYDDGLDNLGRDRRAVPFPNNLRGRAKLQHRHRFGEGFQFTAEAGFISDQNFLEEYYELEWDREKDQTTNLHLQKLYQEHSFNVQAEIRVNEFFTQTESLPRFDHFMLGRSVLGDRATLFSHSQIGYLNMRTAEPLATFPPIPGQADREGIKASTRHELDFPVTIGAVNAVPYVLGELAYWGEDLSGSSLTRAYGQAGIRTSLPLWRANNNVQSTLLNLNGIAHKVSLESDLFYGDVSEDLGDLAIYDSFDDDAQEAFIRRFTDQTFGGTVPLRFDYRSYAFRTNQQGNVSSTVSEIADDIFGIKLGVRQRWQTKRGSPGVQRTVDWITFDIEGTYFPKASRDNFGADVGVVDYDFRWHLGDRLSVVSDGYFDFFGQGLRTASAGVLLNRPELGSMYAGFRTMEGPISSNVFISSYDYRMSEKWILSANSTYDLGAAGNLGQRLVFTRIGESFLVRVGVSSDTSRDNLGFVFALEPRFYARSRHSRLGGVPLPAVGMRGLE